MPLPDPPAAALPSLPPAPTDAASPPAGGEPRDDRPLLHTGLLGALRLPGNASDAMLAALARRAAELATQASGAGTRRVYRSAWRGWERWCARLSLEPLCGDPGVLAMYATHRVDQCVAVSTLRVDLAAIRTAHRLASVPLDLADPRLAMVVEGIVRRRGTRPRRQAAPAVPDVLRLLLGACAPAATPLGARDRAMLLLGFGAALRRSELVALALGDATPVPGRGVRLLVRWSKTDQQGAGQEVAVCANPADPTTCPAAALAAWLAHRAAAADLASLPADERDRRPLFCAVGKSGRLSGAALSDKAVARLVKGAAGRAGLDPERYSGHSLRAGLAAGDAGAALPDLLRQTRHRSTAVALGYLRPADLWRNNVSDGVVGTNTGRPG